MKKRVFLIHGWDSHPKEGCFPWLKKELQSSGFEVLNPLMPNPPEPKIEEWTSFLRKEIGKPDEQTILFGHSIGVQTILRYLASLKENEKVRGVVSLAGWVTLTPAAYEDAESARVAKPWLEAPLSWEEIKKHTGKFTAIFSDNDPFVPLSDAEIFKDKLGAKIIMEEGKEHFASSAGVKELPSALEAVLEIAGEK
jgi:hypothetical protein